MTRQLSDDEVHLIVLRLGPAGVGAAGVVEKDSAVLAADELRRAAAIATPRRRRRFLACRIALRRVLAHYTGVVAADVRIKYSSLGKPLLADPSQPVAFSVSRSGDLGLIAVASSKGDVVLPRLGVDIERVDTDVDALGLAHTAFAAEEIAELQRCEDAQRTELFYRIWTQREAVAKALGVGLRVDPEQLCVDVVSGSEPRLVRTAGDLGTLADWTLCELDVSSSVEKVDVYQTALAMDRACKFFCVTLAWNVIC